MNRLAVVISIGALLLAVACGRTDARSASTSTAGEQQSVTLRAVAPNELRNVEDFAAIAGDDARARALFLEASRVLLHPRCVNCHPDGNAPLQGMDQRPHDPPVERGLHDPVHHADRGLPALSCTNCHQTKNLDHARVPGAPKWALAPREMTWQRRTPHQICEQLKDTKRNGGKPLMKIVDHVAHDELVAWGWSPGHDREPAPGTQAQAGALLRAWMDLGAACPSEEETR
jgi:hypothetical protein